MYATAEILQRRPSPGQTVNEYLETMETDLKNVAEFRNRLIAVKMVALRVLRKHFPVFDKFIGHITQYL